MSKNVFNAISSRKNINGKPLTMQVHFNIQHRIALSWVPFILFRRIYKSKTTTATTSYSHKKVKRDRQCGMMADVGIKKSYERSRIYKLVHLQNICHDLMRHIFNCCWLWLSIDWMLKMLLIYIFCLLFIVLLSGMFWESPKPGKIRIAAQFWAGRRRFWIRGA